MLKPVLKRGGKLLLISFLCCIPIDFCLAQTEKTKSENAPPQKMIVRVLDGITGLPMWFEFPNVWIGSAKDVIPRLNIKGEVQFDVGRAKPNVIRLSPNWYADCRFEADVPSAGSAVEYSIREILENGIVADNSCSSRHANPTPGVIVLYVRHRKLKEIIAL